ncbi:hypothetical protein KUM42_09440 [Modestobacter sp. L9-4]|uniref:hypothetical protein n=1 Tax=Modestobacter sp. L9-4 TaxID=2851567 RepID=UPI001C770CDB|nr:hypothetical protein [Modestobacter sp. L9-4]QXG77692.1 hypothetical protein KUM42_09440 [Modestobacter sp. L9-4]
MRTWLLTAPRWVHRVASGVLFGGLTAVFYGLEDDHSWTAALVGGVAGGVLFGLVMGSWSYRTARGTHAVVAGLTPAQRRTAARVSWHGPAPHDPAVRAAAVRMIDHQLALYLPLRAFTLIVGVLMLALYVMAALVSSPWWWLVVPVWVGMITLSLLAPARLRRRRALLTGAPALS